MYRRIAMYVDYCMGTRITHRADEYIGLKFGQFILSRAEKWTLDSMKYEFTGYVEW